jgi:hypothetical protein
MHAVVLLIVGAVLALVLRHIAVEALATLKADVSSDAAEIAKKL